MPRRALAVVDLSPQERLDRAIRSGSAAVVVDALFDSPASEHWLRILGLAYLRQISGFTSVGVAAHVRLQYEFGAVSGLLAAQKRIARHFRDPNIDVVYGVSEILDAYVQQCLNGRVYLPTVGALATTPPPGRKTALPMPETVQYPEADLIALFPSALDRVERRARREQLRRPQWINELSGELGPSPISIRRFLDTHPAQLAAVDEARKRYVIDER